MQQDEELAIHTLFGALTRPAMSGGVTFEYHGINLAISVMIFILLGNPLYGLVFVPIHIIGWLIHREDVRLIAIVYKRLQLPSNPNQSIRGVRFYEAC